MYVYIYIYIYIVRVKGRKEKERWAKGRKEGIPTERGKKRLVCIDQRLFFERSLSVSEYLSWGTTYLTFITSFTLERRITLCWRLKRFWQFTSILWSLFQILLQSLLMFEWGRCWKKGAFSLLAEKLSFFLVWVGEREALGQFFLLTSALLLAVFFLQDKIL